MFSLLRLRYYSPLALRIIQSCEVDYSVAVLVIEMHLWSLPRWRGPQGGLILVATNTLRTRQQEEMAVVEER
jgi:hypothetical protein